MAKKSVPRTNFRYFLKDRWRLNNHQYGKGLTGTIPVQISPLLPAHPNQLCAACYSHVSKGGINSDKNAIYLVLVRLQPLLMRKQKWAYRHFRKNGGNSTVSLPPGAI
jgi:hypothetical protein